MLPVTPDPHPATAEVAALGAAEVAAALGRRELTAAEVTEQLLARIEALDGGGPAVRSVLAAAPDALDVARARDAERRAGHVRGPLHGVPVLVKDNIDTVAPLPTTAGSFALADSSPGRDATLVGALRDAGAVLLGKANLSEWANFRGRPSSSGWSAVGGQTRNPHVLDRSPGGSSAGSAAAVAARLAPLAVGTETDGSIICPAAACGVAGLKPTVGLVSRTGIVPIAASQDTAGPMARTVTDLALLLEVLAGAVDDGEDNAARAPSRPAGYRTDYRTLMGDGDLTGLRIGIVRNGGYFDYHAPTDHVFAAVLGMLATTGAEIVDPLEGLDGPLSVEEDELSVLCHEFRAGLAAYLARRAGTSPDATGLPRSVDDVLAHAAADPRERLDLFGVELLIQSAACGGLDEPAYRAASERIRRAARTDGLDRLFGAGGVDAVIVPAMAPAWPIDHVLGDHFMGTGWSAAAVAGYPSATIPIGAVGGLPVGAAVLGPAWSEATLLRVLRAVERLVGTDVSAPRPAFVRTLAIP